MGSLSVTVGGDFIDHKCLESLVATSHVHEACHVLLETACGPARGEAKASHGGTVSLDDRLEGRDASCELRVGTVLEKKFPNSVLYLISRQAEGNWSSASLGG